MTARISLRQALRRGRTMLVVVSLLACQVARADIEVVIHGVDQQLRDNVLVYLSFERYKKRDKLDRDTLERLLNRVDREVKSAMKPFGYYEPRVHSELEDRGNGNWRVTVNIEPGTPVIMRAVDVKVTGPGAVDPLFERITKKLPLRPGERLSHAAYDQLKSDLQRTAATYGYIDAKFSHNELRVDPANHYADAVLELATGPRYRFGATTIEQNAIGDAIVRRFIRYRQNDPYDVTQLLRTQFALDDSQYFSTVEVLPGDPDRERRVIPIHIHALRNKRHRYSVGAGYGTDTGPRGTLGYEDRLIDQRGDRLSVQVQDSAITKAVTSRYIVPVGDPALEKDTLQFTVEQQLLGDLTTQDETLQPSITRMSGRWQRVLFVSAIDTTTDSLGGNRTDKLLVPGVNLALVPQGYLGETLLARTLFIELKGSTTSLGSDSDFVQLHVQSERSFDLSPRWHLLLRGELGATLVPQATDLPGILRFFAGGDRSVRGFYYDELSPTQTVCQIGSTGKPILGANGACLTENIKVGGKDVITGSVEFERDLPRNFGVATFADFGNAFDHFGVPLEYSVGLGIRYRLPAVTMGIDLAQPLSLNAGPRLNINFSTKL